MSESRIPTQENQFPRTNFDAGFPRPQKNQRINRTHSTREETPITAKPLEESGPDFSPIITQIFNHFLLASR